MIGYEYRKKGYKMLEVVKTQFIGFDFGMCEVCDNHTPRVEVDDEIGCLICYEAYGELN